MLEQEELLPQIKQGLEKKLDAMVMRELYTKYKTAPTEEEKEKARKEYLDRRGVPESPFVRQATTLVDGTDADSILHIVVIEIW